MASNPLFIIPDFFCIFPMNFGMTTLGLKEMGKFFWEGREKSLPSWLSQISFAKGQLILKAIYGMLTSPKKQMDEFDLFAFLLFTANKSNSFVRFLGKSTARQSAFQFYLTFTPSCIGIGFYSRFSVLVRHETTYLCF